MDMTALGGTSDAAVVKLTADTSSWEKALDDSAKAMNDWAKRLDQQLHPVKKSTSVLADSFEQLKETLDKSLNAKFGVGLADSLKSAASASLAVGAALLAADVGKHLAEWVGQSEAFNQQLAKSKQLGDELAKVAARISAAASESIGAIVDPDEQARAIGRRIKFLNNNLIGLRGQESFLLKDIAGRKDTQESFLNSVGMNGLGSALADVGDFLTGNFASKLAGSEQSLQSVKDAITRTKDELTKLKSDLGKLQNPDTNPMFVRMVGERVKALQLEGQAALMDSDALERLALKMRGLTDEQVKKVKVAQDLRNVQQAVGGASSAILEGVITGQEAAMERLKANIASVIGLGMGIGVGASGEHPERGSVSANVAGSQGAANAIARAMLQSNSPQQQMLKTEQDELKELKDQTRKMQSMIDELKQLPAQIAALFGTF